MCGCPHTPFFLPIINIVVSVWLLGGVLWGGRGSPPCPLEDMSGQCIEGLQGGGGVNLIRMS